MVHNQIFYLVMQGGAKWKMTRDFLKVRKFQNEFMKSSFLPKYEQKILGETMTS